MKFKELSARTGIGRVIDMTTITSAPLDNKNVMTDWIDEQLFYTYAIHPFNSKKMLGYIGEIAVELQYNGNTMFVKCIHGITDTTDAIVLGRFSEIFNISLESEEMEDSELIVISQTIKGMDTYMIHFYKGKYIGK